MFVADISLTKIVICSLENMFVTLQGDCLSSFLVLWNCVYSCVCTAVRCTNVIKHYLRYIKLYMMDCKGLDRKDV